MLLVWILLAAAIGGGAGFLAGRSGLSAGEVDESAEHERAGSDARVLRAVETLALGFVLYGSRGGQVFQNTSAMQLGGTRHQRPLVDAALENVANRARVEGAAADVLELFGPPRQVLEFKGEAVLIDGHQVGVVVIIEDITEKRRTIDVRRDFVANVSHELKTPVAAMGLLAEALIDSDDPAVADRLSARLHAEAIRLGNTIDDLLALSDIESGTLASREPVEASLVIAGALERSAAAAEMRDIAVDVEDRTTGPIVGDRRQLVAAVGNLVDNAIKYSDPGSRVRLVAETRGVGPDARVVIEVIDAGIGIPPSDRERIFERFYRVDLARSRNTGGTGLGLSIVRHVVANHDGLVELDSVEGQGSTFRLELPTAAPDDHDAAGARPHRASAPNPSMSAGEEERA